MLAKQPAAWPRKRPCRSGSEPQSGRAAQKVKASSRPSFEASEQLDIQATMRKRDRGTTERPSQIAWKAPQRPGERSLRVKTKGNTPPTKTGRQRRFWG